MGGQAADLMVVGLLSQGSGGQGLSKKDLERILEEIPGFKKPMRILEQYQTPSWLVAEMIFTAALKGDLGERASDLGCGTGRISAALALMGVDQVLCIDISCRDLEAAKEHLSRLGLLDRVEIICWDLFQGPLRDLGLVVMNPPFGVYRRGSDLVFLRTAMKASHTIYSIHKYNDESLNLIRSTALKEGFNTEVLGIYNMEISAMFESHRRRIYRFPVMLIKLSRSRA